jgi:hypothetical protein
MRRVLTSLPPRDLALDFVAGLGLILAGIEALAQHAVTT